MRHGAAALALLLMTGCGLAFRGPSQATAVNHSSRSVSVLLAEDPSSTLVHELGPGDSIRLDWPVCTDGWVVVTSEAGDELYRDQQRICPDDRVEVSVNEAVAVRCGSLSHRERDC